MEQLEGELTEEKEDFMKEEQETFQQYEELLAEKQQAYEKHLISDGEMTAVNQLAARKLEPREAFFRAAERVEEAKQTGEIIVYETGYLELFGYGADAYTKELQEALLLILAVMLVIVPGCAGEYAGGMNNLIAAQYYGRRETLKGKIISGILAVTMISFIVYLPRIIYVGKVYGYPCFDVSLGAISKMQGMTFHWSIGSYFVFIYLGRIIISIVTMLLAMSMSVYLKDTVRAIAAITVILALPLVLHLMGLTGVDWCTFNPIYSVNMVFNQKKINIMVAETGITILGAVGSILYLLHTIGNET